MPETRHDLRCFCSRKPKLAEWGRTADGKPYVHIRIFKQTKLFGEVVATSGSLDICCRECLRWTHVTIQSDVGIQRNQRVPAAVAS